MYGGAVVVVTSLNVTGCDVFPVWAQADRGLHSPTHSSVCSEHLLRGNRVAPSSLSIILSLFLLPWWFIWCLASFTYLITDGVTCLRVLKVVRETVSLLSSTTHPRGWAYGTWSCRPSFPKCRWLPKEWVRWHLKPWVLRGSIEKSQGSEGKWVSFINIHKTT